MSYPVICGNSAPWEPDEWPDDAEAIPCCMGSAMWGPSGCTCWEPVFDLEQTEPDERELSVEDLTVRSRACTDCAYLPGSTERADEWEWDQLRSLPARAGSVFMCHFGMRRVLEWRHPDGRVHVAEPGDYKPPIRGIIAYKADGKPGDVCAGFAARRKALT